MELYEILKRTPVDKNIEVIHKETCPICERDLQVVSEGMFQCNNECYDYTEGHASEGYEIFYIFGYEIFISPLDFTNNLNELAYDQVRQLIAYYRENDRYLAEILTR